MAEDTQSNLIAKGGVEMEVVLESGHKETVKVKLLPLGKMPEYFSALDDDMKMIQLVTGKSEAFAQALDFDSGLAVLDAAEKVNGPNAKRWAEAKINRVAPLATLAQQTAKFLR